MSADDLHPAETPVPEVIQVAAEYLPDEDTRVLVDLLTNGDGDNAVTVLLGTVSGALRSEDRKRTRVVFTGDFIASVNSRSWDDAPSYTVDRGAGIVGAKTMSPLADGTVEIIIPTYSLAMLIPNEEGESGAHLVLHTVLHEAVHATFHHIGDEPFAVLGRHSFGAAMREFVAMAAEQLNEYLAETISMQGGAPRGQTDAEDVRTTFEAFGDTLSKQLSTMDESDPDYWARAKDVTLAALNVLWKNLTYLAAELRVGDSFVSVPEDIACAREWQSGVAPWWGRYLTLLDRVSISYDQDVATTDETSEQIAYLLQEWALALGFDFHDTDEGRNAWFGFIH